MLGVFIIACVMGCVTQANLPVDEIWPEEKNMTRLERQVMNLCEDLTEGISPGTIHLAWYDNLHPESPMLSDVYIVSMMRRSLTAKGFSIVSKKDNAVYTLNMVMTPGKKCLVMLASIHHNDQVISTRESVFINRSEKWNQSLISHRYRTDTLIPLGGKR
ncbi:MAG: hypothetical protein U9P80_09015 [Thermodesulfobacteriota bacterium]|nr:hypothetical protein [Thermodesulfobacteriota bacterium]